MDSESAVTNDLPAGITYEQIEQAVQNSGYPLQTTVSELLRGNFFVLPEWGYRDRTSDELRTMDVLALDPIEDVPENCKILPYSALLIECKQSSLPYVFFSEVIHINETTSRIPRICGLAGGDWATIITDDSQYAHKVRYSQVLGLDNVPFIPGPETCSVFSKCVRKGKGLELSGTDAYSGIVMPLMSAMEYFEKVNGKALNNHLRAVILLTAVAVVNGPMVVYDTNATEGKIRSTSWQRVIRNEPTSDLNPFLPHMGAQSAIDIVHKDFFPTYLHQHIRPLGRRFWDVLTRHHSSFYNGMIRVSGYGSDKASNIPDRIVDEFS